jgi:NCS1 family nucleobase:cation symporter-1
LIGYPIASALPCLYGILVAAAAKKLTGTAYWNVWDVMSYMLSQYPDNKGARFGIFLCAVAMALSYLAVNLATNSLPFGSDVTAMFPRWMTIRRGQVLCTLLGIAIVPWKLLNSAQAFLTFREFPHRH